MVSLEVKEDAASCVRFMVEGCAVASMQGMQEERETAARVRVERLREEVAWLAEALEAAEIELERGAIAREGLVEALAASAAESTASDRVTPDYHRILGVLEERRSAGKGRLR
ncbi:hypothetical protein ACWDA7_11135 [Streptomyces sp. NPDC001156]